MSEESLDFLCCFARLARFDDGAFRKYALHQKDPPDVSLSSSMEMNTDRDAVRCQNQAVNRPEMDNSTSHSTGIPTPRWERFRLSCRGQLRRDGAANGARLLHEDW
jgi:hypothetical protein